MSEDARLTAIPLKRWKLHHGNGEQVEGYLAADVDDLLASHARAVEARPQIKFADIPVRLDPTMPIGEVKFEQVAAARPHDLAQASIRAAALGNILQTLGIGMNGSDDAIAVSNTCVRAIDALRAALSAKDQQIAHLQRDLDIAEETVIHEATRAKTAETALGEARQQLVALRDQLDRAEAHRNLVVGRLALRDMRIVELEVALSAKGQQVLMWIGKFKEVRGELANHETELWEARQQLAALRQWQPIETAPKDGKEILLIVGGLEISRVDIGHWTPVERRRGLPDQWMWRYRR